MPTWCSIPSLPGYEASDDGRIRSIDREVGSRWGHPITRKGRELKTFVRRSGYLGGNVSIDGVRMNFEVHRLVCEAFHGPQPDGMEVRHVNGVRLDVRPENLEWGTRSQNQLDKIGHGTHHEVNKTHCPQGHEYSPENTRIINGKRCCVECIRARDRARQPARSEARRRKRDHL